MSCRISHLTVDSRDAYAQSTWWAETLAMAEDPVDPNEPGDVECMIFSADGRARMLFIEVADVKRIKNRLHLDLRPLDTREAEVDRLLARHATLMADRRRPDGSGWVTMADPEGNEFCVLRGDHESVDPYAHLVR